MNKKVLVIGGSYFAGRIFSTIAAEDEGFELTLINRGKYSMAHLPNVKEYKCDRHDPAALAAIPEDTYDAIVDFCAYTPSEIRLLLDNLKGHFRRYILMSTADVYDRRMDNDRSENCPLYLTNPGGPAGDYIFFKAMLERELHEACAEHHINTTIIRPAFIYGPYNYAPRESVYVRMIVGGQPVPVPTDATARFQFVYVKDVANALIACIKNPHTANEAYNLAAPEIMTYQSFTDLMKKVSDIPFETVPVTVADVIEQRIPLPFPLNDYESEVFNGEKAVRELGITYTPIEVGMGFAYRAFKSIYSR